MACALTVVGTQQAELEPYGPWMFNVWEEPPNPDRIGYWWRLARDKAGLMPSSTSRSEGSAT